MVFKARRLNIIILQRVLLLQTARTNPWPTAVELHTTLYGSREEAEKTATVTLQTGLAVSAAAIEEKKEKREAAISITCAAMHHITAQGLGTLSQN